MKLQKIVELLEGKVLSRGADMDLEIEQGCGADLMSDVLTFSKERALLLTGLTNPQVVRTAEMADIAAIVFARGKLPPAETIALAEEKGIPLVSATYTLFEMCGRLYAAGMNSCDVPMRQS